MVSDEEKEIALIVLNRLVEDSTSILTDLDGEPFVIIGGWDELSRINEGLNEARDSRLWAEWRPVYLAADLLHNTRFYGGPSRNPFSDLRLGEFNAEKHYDDNWRLEKKWDMLAAWRLLKELGRAHPSNSSLYYTVPDGLIQLGDVCEWGFYDEYDTCHGCATAIRTAPTSYSWQLEADDSEWRGLLCPKCMDKEAYLDERTNRNALVNLVLVDPAEYGWEQLDEHYRNDWNGGDDDPKNIIAKLNKFGYDVIFTGDVAQFGIGFYAWVRPASKDEEE